MQFMLAADADVTGPPEWGIALCMSGGLLTMAGIHILPQCVCWKAFPYAMQGLKYSLNIVMAIFSQPIKQLFLAGLIVCYE